MLKTKPLLEVSGLRKSFGGLQAVAGFNLAVQEGQIVSLIGPNGSGKTTLFNLITGLIPASAGRVLFAGRHELLGLKPHTITALGIARTFQNQRLFNQMTVLENVLVGRHCRSKAGLSGIVFSLPSARAEKARAIASPTRCRTRTAVVSRSRGRSRPIRACSCSTSRRPE
jgi:ABC-type branched-subunit amino acid transport system ATPase component